MLDKLSKNTKYASMNSKISKSRPRPLSPHIQVYSWLITSTMSILHRLTGVVLSLGLLMVASWLITMAYYPESHVVMAKFLRSIIGNIFLIGWSAALFYHSCNGIRHLFWDFGKGFELKTATASGYFVLIMTVILTALTWLAATGEIIL